MTHTVLTRIAIVLVLVGVGWIARRARLVNDASLGSMSRLLVDLAFPALVFVRLLQTVDAPALAAEWALPLGALLMLPGGWLLGSLIGRNPTRAFLIGLPNWIFLPLLISEGLFGPMGARPVLLFNAGAQLALWTVGIATLTGERDPMRLLRNPGLWATIFGLAGALALPTLGALARAPQLAEGWAQIPATGLEALELVGGMSIPLALCITGAQLGGLSIRASLQPSRALFQVLITRLLIVPAIWTGVVLVSEVLGLTLSAPARLVLILIAAMPVAISGAVHSRRFGGDADLAAQAVLWSTVLSLVTVPLLVAVVV